MAILVHLQGLGTTIIIINNKKTSYHLVSYFSSSLSSPNPVSNTLLAPLYEIKVSTTLADSLKIL